MLYSFNISLLMTAELLIAKHKVTADSFFCFLLCLASPSQFLDSNSFFFYTGTFHIVLLKCTAVFSSSILTHLRIAMPDSFEVVPIFQMASLLFLRSLILAFISSEVMFGFNSFFF